MNRRYYRKSIFNSFQHDVLSATDNRASCAEKPDMRLGAAVRQTVQSGRDKDDPDQTLLRSLKKTGSEEDFGTPAVSGINGGMAADIAGAAERYIETDCPYLEDENDPETRFYITRNVNIGRYPHNDIQIKEETVARIHCRIYIKNGKYYLINMGQDNYTRLNGIEVDNFRPAYEEDFFKYELNDGDTIAIGLNRYRFRMAAEAPGGSAFIWRGDGTLE